MKAEIMITKNFDEERVLTKEYKHGDLKQFFLEEGEYLDELAKVLEEKGTDEDEFAVAYVVMVKK